MRVLIVGATGFIGSAITAKLLQQGMAISCAARNVAACQRQFPMATVTSCNLETDLDPSFWIKRLDNIDAVINVVGVLQTPLFKTIENIHFKGPQALVTACLERNISKFIHISALGIDQEKTTPYSSTKLAFEQYLQKQSLDWIILKPSLVYDLNCYGGTNLLRALAICPYVIPIIGKGDQVFQPIHLQDLSEIVVRCLSKDIRQKILAAVGPEPMMVKDILKHLRTWLGMPSAPFFSIPTWLIRLVCTLGDYIPNQPLNTTSFKMMHIPNISDPQPLINTLQYKSHTFEYGLAISPPSIQSLWHARLYLVRPLLKIGLGFFWIGAGLVSLFFPSQETLALLTQLGISKEISHVLWLGSCCIDIILGTFLLFSVQQVTVLQTMFVLTLGYTIFLSVFFPTLWLNPLGELMKNIPILLVTLVFLAISRDR